MKHSYRKILIVTLLLTAAFTLSALEGEATLFEPGTFLVGVELGGNSYIGGYGLSVGAFAESIIGQFQFFPYMPMNWGLAGDAYVSISPVYGNLSVGGGAQALLHWGIRGLDDFALMPIFEKLDFFIGLGLGASLALGNGGGFGIGLTAREGVAYAVSETTSVYVGNANYVGAYNSYGGVIGIRLQM